MSQVEKYVPVKMHHNYASPYGSCAAGGVVDLPESVAKSVVEARAGERVDQPKQKAVKDAPVAVPSEEGVASFVDAEADKKKQKAVKDQ